MLQWSPFRIEGETPIAARLDLQPLIASMEPLPNRRGNHRSRRHRQGRPRRFNGAPSE